jgi:glutathione S-transferase
LFREGFLLSQLLRMNSPTIPENIDMIKVYWSPRTRSFTALWLMEETGQPYERILTEINTDATATPEYLAINPMGKVPALTDGDVAVAESAAICTYIADRFPDAKLAPPIGDPRRGRYLQWLFFSPGCIEPAIIQVFTKLEVPRATAAWGNSSLVFDVLDQALAKGPWLLGDQFTAADIAIGAGLNFAVRVFKMVPTRPNFDRYLDALAARPAFQRAMVLTNG